MTDTPLIKPDWRDAPSWANYLARDKDGRWFWFESEPEREECGFSASYGGKTELAEPVEIRWRQTLEKKA